MHAQAQGDVLFAGQSAVFQQGLVLLLVSPPSEASRATVVLLKPQLAQEEAPAGAVRVLGERCCDVAPRQQTAAQPEPFLGMLIVRVPSHQVADVGNRLRRLFAAAPSQRRLSGGSCGLGLHVFLSWCPGRNCVWVQIRVFYKQDPKRSERRAEGGGLTVVF